MNCNQYEQKQKIDIVVLEASSRNGACILKYWDILNLQLSWLQVEFSIAKNLSRTIQSEVAPALQDKVNQQNHDRKYPIKKFVKSFLGFTGKKHPGDLINAWSLKKSSSNSPRTFVQGNQKPAPLALCIRRFFFRGTTLGDPEPRPIWLLRPWHNSSSRRHGGVWVFGLVHTWRFLVGKVRVKRVVFFVCCHSEASGIPTKKTHDSLVHQKIIFQMWRSQTQERNTWRENFRILDEERWDMAQFFLWN